MCWVLEEEWGTPVGIGLCLATRLNSPTTCWVCRFNAKDAKTGNYLDHIVDDYCAIQPGYKSQWQDCMICSYVGGPLLTRFDNDGWSWFIVLHVPIDDDLMMTWYLFWTLWEWQWWWVLLALGVQCVCVAPGVQVCIHCSDWSALHCCILQFTAFSLKDLFQWQCTRIVLVLCNTYCLGDAH